MGWVSVVLVLLGEDERTKDPDDRAPGKSGEENGEVEFGVLGRTRRGDHRICRRRK